MIQTHVSAIFLAGERVYKVKKAGEFRVSRFYHPGEAEVFLPRKRLLLNRRLSPEVYLGVVDIRLQEGRIVLGEGPGEIIEYAVLMKKLPSGRA